MKYNLIQKSAFSKKSKKFPSGLEKRNVMCGTIKTLLDNEKEITTLSEISLTLKKVYGNDTEYPIFIVQIQSKTNLKLYKIFIFC